MRKGERFLKRSEKKNQDKEQRRETREKISFWVTIEIFILVLLDFLGI